MDFKEKVIQLLSTETKIKSEEIKKLLTVPPKGLGDFAFPCFVLAKEMKKSPIAVAQELSEKFSGKNKASFIEKVEAKGPYINFFISADNLSEQVLENIFSGVAFQTKLGKGKVMVEYSSPNTNKPLHLGHLRNNTLGLAISNLLEQTGHKVVKANLVNDRGIHICKSMIAYKKFGNSRDPKKEGIKSDHFVGEMYVLYNEKLKEDPKLEEEAQEMLKQWEAGNKEVIALWKKMNLWATEGMKETYNEYGTKFDEWFFESDLFKKGNSKKIIEEGLAKGIFKKEDNGAIVAVLEPEIQNKVLLRGDGTSLYATNDLALTQYKFDEFKLDKCIWVVANEQDLYFKQLFKIFEKLGRKWASDCFHLSYGYVSLTTGKMKSREGTVVDADDLLAEEKEIALQEIKKRYPALKDKDAQVRAKKIALAAIKFYLLKNDARKDMVFDAKESISFEGETGPYVQYTYARAKSILRKAKEEKIKYKKGNFDLLIDPKEKELILALGNFSDAIKKSWENLSLHSLCHNILSIAEKFNSFYHEVSVLKSESKELINARLSLVGAVSITIKKGLEILDVEAIEEM